MLLFNHFSLQAGIAKRWVKPSMVDMHVLYSALKGHHICFPKHIARSLTFIFFQKARYSSWKVFV